MAAILHLMATCGPKIGNHVILGGKDQPVQQLIRAERAERRVPAVDGHKIGQLARGDLSGVAA